MSYEVPRDEAQCSVTFEGKTKQYELLGRVVRMVHWLCHNERALGSWSKGTVLFTYDGRGMKVQLTGED